MTARLAAGTPDADRLDVHAYQARTGTATTEAGQWAARYATAALDLYGIADTRQLTPEQSARCERAADRAQRSQR